MKYPLKSKYILAIDSGATKSEALIYPVGALPLAPNMLKERKKLYKYPFINLNLLGFEESLNRLKKIVTSAEKFTGKGNITQITAGISGARYENDRKKLQIALSKATGIKNVIILTDTEIALAAEFNSHEKNCGILISGTGSILYYRGSTGKINRIGGWGRYIGDEGSGYWIAREALYKVTKHYDKRLNANILAKVLKTEFGIDETNIIQKVYHNGFDISKLTKHVFKCAEKGDKISKGIIKDAAENLMTHFIPLKMQKFTIALTGSLLREEKLLAIELNKAAKKNFPNIKFIKPKLKPVWGAVKTAVQNIKKHKVITGNKEKL